MIKGLILRSPRAQLRRPVSGDLDALLALDNDPLVMQWLNGGLPVSRHRFERDLLPVFLTFNERDLMGFWIAESEGFLGWLSLRPTESDGEAGLGFRFCQAVWGHGYATELGKLLISACFAEGELRRLVATTYEANVGSQRVLQKLGFNEVRRYRLAPEDLSDTNIHEGEIWEGEEIEFECFA